ncbi:MAG TPA: amylo-alpha-1,6-glucosidase [Candidatus Acidoferrum sp.]
MATTALASAPIIKLAGPAWSPNFWNKAESSPVSILAEIQFGREICGDLDAAEKREWLVTNGIGGFASGTIAGTATRRYHGLLMAALQPPATRTLLVSGLDETVHYLDSSYSLSTNRWASGFNSPSGFLQIESFHIEGTKPVWRFAFADAILEKRVWMEQGENTTYVQYTLVRASGPIELDGKVLVTYRDFHSATHGGPGWQMKVRPIENGLRIDAFAGSVPFVMKSSSAFFQPRQEWYRDYLLPAERIRGLDDTEDRLFAGQFHSHLEVGQSITLVLSTDLNSSLDGEQARTSQSNHEWNIFQSWQKHYATTNPSSPNDEPGWLWQLVLAADQFIVKRSLPGNPDGCSIIAGYHWFGDWGRDTMISLPGLTLSTGRPEIARQILKAYAAVVDAGMLPNRFPDAGGGLEYNTVDATLWYFEAIRQYFSVKQDLKLLNELFPVLAGIIDAHVRGTRYNIKVDPFDGLLFAGSPLVQLTWMDSKIGDWVVTPRVGKPVEINALWINALQTMAGFAKLLVRPFEGYEKLSAKASKNFEKFWNVERNCCFDVIDVPNAPNDPALRPNQIFAVSLPVSPLSDRQQKAVVDICAQQLLTSHGLRSLAPSEYGYKGHCAGGARERDAAYHQGTVWAWLLGPFALAHFRVYKDRSAAQSFLDPLGRTIYNTGLGTINEIFDGDSPYNPSGAIAQAWSVAELFRAWQLLGAAE